MSTVTDTGMTAGRVYTDRLPVLALLALATTGFISIATETLPAGLLPQIAGELGISHGLAGQMVAIYALGSLLAAIPLTILTNSWPRRRVLLLTVFAFLVFNLITAFSSNLYLIFAARFLAGTAAGLGWSIIGGYARRMVAPHLQGKALAMAMIGTPIALSIGVPLGTWLGSAVGWRMAFVIMSVLAVVLIGWIIAKVPDYPGVSSTSKVSFGSVLTTPGVRPVLFTALAWMLAHNVLYTFIAPYLAPSGLEDRTDLMLLVFGVASLVGIFGIGRLVDRHLRRTVLISLVVFLVAVLILGVAMTSPVAVFIGVAIWGITFGGAATLLQTALADSAGDGADVALSMSTVAWNAAIAGGGVIGGILVDGYSAVYLPWAMAIIVAIALVTAWSAKANGFQPGERQRSEAVAGH